jgi:hypothetical protein
MAKKLISVSEIEPGMVLTEPVKNRNGQILLNTGIFLEEKHKILLKTWGIGKLSVKSDGDENSSSAVGFPEEKMLALKNRLNWQPRNYQENELIELALIYIESEKV